MMGVSGVMSRISELQSRLGLAPAPTSTPTTAPATGRAAAATGAATTATRVAGNGTAFASALAAARGPAPAPSTGGRAGVQGDDVVAAARKYLGTRYVFGSTDPARGLDCSALVQRAYGDLGITLPRNSGEQAKVGTKVTGLAAARPGDILAFDSPVDHVAIYLGGNKMIAAPKPGDHVKIQTVYETPTAIRRVVGDTAATPAVVRPTTLRDGGLPSSVPYADMFAAAGARHGVSAKLLAAVAKVESGYDPKAVSPVGAQGLMQLMPSTARGLGVRNSFDPEQAINGAAKLLAANLEEFKSVPLALAAYNAGGGSVRKYGGIPPFAETQAYVPKVTRALAALG